MRSPESIASGFLHKRTLSLAELALLIGTAIAALSFQVALPRRLPTEENYRQMAEVLEREQRDGDVVLLYPWWTERARLFIPGSLPVVGYFGSDADPLSSYSRIWLVAQPSLPRSDLVELQRRFLPGRTALAASRSYGRLELTLYRNELFRPTVFSAVSEYASAHVYIETPGGHRVECPFDGTTHRCPGKEHLHVAAEWHEVLYQPRRCLWMHPPGGARRLVAEFPSARIGDRLALAAGIVGEYASRRHPELTATHVGVDAVEDDRHLLDLSISPGAEGMHQAARSGAPEMPATLGLRVWVQSDNPSLREACVELFSDRGGKG